MLILEQIKRDSNGCWLWQGYVSGRPGYEYGVLTINYKAYKVTKLVLHLWTGLPLDSKLLSLHRCDVPACVNPRHLYAGTVKNNVQDAIDRGRWTSRKGTQHHNVKLNDKEVLFIRASKVAGYLLERKFKVSRTTITNIRNRDTWKHI